MNTADFLEELGRLGIQVSAEQGSLRIHAPRGAVTADIKEQLSVRKAEIIAFLALAQRLRQQLPALVPLQPAGERPVCFGVAGHNGDVFCYRALAEALGPDRPFYGLQPPGHGPDDVPLRDVRQLATFFAEQIIASGLGDDCILLGYCAGGTVAFELARQLMQSGVSVRHVLLVSAPYSTWYRRMPQRLAASREWLAAGKRLLGRVARNQSLAPIRSAISNRLHPHSPDASVDEDVVQARRRRVEAATLAAVAGYIPERTDLSLQIVVPGNYVFQTRRSLLQWRKASPRHAIIEAPAASSNDNMLSAEYAAALAVEIRRLQRDG